MNLFFCVANNVVPVEYILDIHSFYDALTEAARYNASVWCHYISWALKIRMGNGNDINNGFTWIKCFTQVCHNMENMVF